MSFGLLGSILPGSIRTLSRFTLPGRKAGMTPPQSQVKSTATWVSLAGLADVPDTTNSSPQASHLHGLEKSAIGTSISRVGGLVQAKRGICPVYSGVASEAPPDVESLFQLPLEGFTEARNALAARLRTEGKAGTAGEVKALTKPPASAWAVNQVYWKSRPEYDALLESGARLLKVQRSGAGGEDLREAMRQRRSALQAALGKAEAALVAADLGAGPQVMRRVGATLEALASGADVPRAGTLTADLEPPGFEALAGLAPSAPRPKPPAGKPPAAKPSASEADREEARALEAAERSRLEFEAARLRRRAQEAAAAVAEARERLQGAEREEQEAERRFEKARERVLQSQKAVGEAEAAAKEATRAAAAAERSLKSS